MRAYAVIVMEIPGEKNDQFVTEGKFSLLKRMMVSAVEAATACVRVAPGAGHAESMWTDDVDPDLLAPWQLALMDEVEEQ